MKQKNILILVLIAAVLVVAGVVVSQRHDGDRKLSGGGVLAPDLRATIDGVEDIRVVTRTGDAVTQVTLQKKAGQWLVQDHNYRADTTQLAKLINTLAQAKKVEAKTAKPENYGRLGVRDPAAEKGQGTGTLVRLLTADGKPQFELIIGTLAQSGRGQYVRVASEAQAWLIDQSLQLPTRSADWLDHAIANIAAEEIVAADFGGLLLKRPEPDKPLELSAAIPPGRELSYDGVAATAASALSQLELKDVVARDAIKFDKPAFRATFTTKAGVAIAVDAYRQQEKNYLTLAATASGAADEAARKQADAWNATWQPWVFEVETFTYNKFVKSINDFTKEKPKPSKAS